MGVGGWSIFAIGKPYAGREFGSRKAMLRFWIHALQARYLFRYRRYANADWRRVERLVFVCAGNICRSPYGEYVAKKMGQDAISFGLTTRGDDPANERASTVAMSRGLDLLHHRSRSSCDVEFSSADLLICMEVEQARRLEARSDLNNAQIVLLGMFCDKSIPHIPDPYAKSEAYFRRCFDWIEAGTESICSTLTATVRR